jgi:hypothetical protein
MESERTSSGYVHALNCAECQRVSSVGARGWKAYRTDDPYDEEDSPALAFYCPLCAHIELGPR